jgi:hypothetical protein
MNLVQKSSIAILVLMIAMICPTNANGFSETIDLDGIGFAAGIAVDNEDNLAGTLAMAPNGAMNSVVTASVGSNGALVNQQTTAVGSDVFAASMAGDLDEAQGCFFTTTSKAYTDVHVTDGGFSTNQGANTIEDPNTIDDLNAYQLTYAVGNEISSDTYAENENGYSGADVLITDGTTTFLTLASSDQDLASAKWAGDIDGSEASLHTWALIYDGPIQADAWGNLINPEVSLTELAWQDGTTVFAGII